MISLSPALAMAPFSDGEDGKTSASSELLHTVQLHKNHKEISTSLFVGINVGQSISLSICPSVCLSVCLFACLPAYLLWFNLHFPKVCCDTDLLLHAVLSLG